MPPPAPPELVQVPTTPAAPLPVYSGGEREQADAANRPTANRGRSLGDVKFGMETPLSGQQRFLRNAVRKAKGDKVEDPR
jgi:hypothetical protein